MRQKQRELLVIALCKCPVEKVSHLTSTKGSFPVDSPFWVWSHVTYKFTKIGKLRTQEVHGNKEEMDL